MVTVLSCVSQLKCRVDGIEVMRAAGEGEDARALNNRPNTKKKNTDNLL